jgi:hypothetical protein
VSCAGCNAFIGLGRRDVSSFFPRFGNGSGARFRTGYARLVDARFSAVWCWRAVFNVEVFGGLWRLRGLDGRFRARFG